MKSMHQISVFVENKPGRLFEVVEILGANNIDIKAISLADSSDFGIVRLICIDVENVYNLLINSGFTASLTDVLSIVINDKPGSLARSLKILKDNFINIEYMYGFSAKIEGMAVMIIKVSDIENAVKYCLANNIQTLSDKDISSIV